MPNYPHLLACKARFNISEAIDWFNKSCADVGQILKGNHYVKTVETESVSVIKSFGMSRAKGLEQTISSICVPSSTQQTLSEVVQP